MKPLPRHGRGKPLAITKPAALTVIRFYVLLSGAWIILSDVFVYLHGGGTMAATLVGIAKGLLYVGVTATLLYLFMTRWVRESAALGERLRQLSNYANDIVLLLDQDGRVIEANDRAAEAYGYPLAVLLTMEIGHLLARDGPGTSRADIWQGEDHVLFESFHRRADGSSFPTEVSSRRVKLDGRFVVQSIIRDISERKAAERQIIRLKDIHAALSQTNQCIVRTADRNEMFATICRVAVQFGHFRMAWIGLIDEDGKRVVPVESAGEDTSFLTDFAISTERSSPFSAGPTGQAAITGRHHIHNDVRQFFDSTSRRQKLLATGVTSAAAFPLFTAGRVIGTLTLYSDEPDFFAPDLIDLLSEMATDISYALDRMAAEQERLRLAADLAMSNARIAGIIEGSQDIIATVSRDLHFTGFNRAYGAAQRRLTGVEMRTGMALAEALAGLPEASAARVVRRWQRALAGEYFSEEWSHGQTYFDSHYGPLLDPEENLIGAFHVGREITQRKLMEFELHKLSTAIEQSPVVVMITDTEGAIQYVNPAFSVSSGYQAAEVIGKTPRILKSGHTPAEEYQRMWALVKSGTPWFGLLQNRRKDGGLYWEETIIAPVRDAAGTITQFICIKQDVTKRREAEENAAFLTYHDALTRLPNRILGKDRMERAMINADRAGCKAAMLVVNVDHFKRINDSLGIELADSLLRALADRILQCIRETDTLGRQGSDEFLIALPGIADSETINRVAAQILDRTANPFTLEGVELSVTVSIGIALYPDDGGDFETLLRQANTAMRHAKEAGRNTYRFFSERMNVDAGEYLVLLNGLRRSVERNQLVLHYQPQLSVATGQVVGAEALIRWKHPDRGLVPPGKFISIAEDSGLIVEMGEWVLREACRQASGWHCNGSAGLVVAVNLSAVQFKRGGLFEIVQRALNESALDPCRLELELTESILIKDTANVLTTVKQLRALGVRLSIDDFGTGYSSLAYLRLLDLDKLKIDQSFIRDLASNRDDETIVKAIVQLAQGLGLKTIAEGVENAETFKLIRAHGCDEVQGYYLARPMPPEQFTGYLQSAKPFPPA